MPHTPQIITHDNTPWYPFNVIINIVILLLLSLGNGNLEFTPQHKSRYAFLWWWGMKNALCDGPISHDLGGHETVEIYGHCHTPMNINHHNLRALNLYLYIHTIHLNFSYFPANLDVGQVCCFVFCTCIY